VPGAATGLGADSARRPSGEGAKVVVGDLTLPEPGKGSWINGQALNVDGGTTVR
jgi:NAD(P)-dependent dehydrogenase (short-subunit alcohol dehydrogenase family)